MSLQLLVILVPLLFGIMGFALDLGRLYLIKAELNQAATAMALEAATKLIGTAGALDNATTAANLVLDDTTSHAAKYNFGMLTVGQTTGLLASTVNDPAYYSSLAAATGTDTSGNGNQADGTTAKHAVITLSADAPLLFWSFLSLGQSRKTTVGAQAIAGISAPVCTACGIEPFAVAAISTDDTLDYGFVQGSLYTFYYQCRTDPINLVTAPPGLADPDGNSTTSVPFAVIDRCNADSTLTEDQQLYRIGAQGLLASTTRTQACMSIGAATDTLWSPNCTALQPNLCNQPSPAGVTQIACGLDTRFETTVQDACQTVTDVDSIAAVYNPDTDLTAYSANDYASYTGTTRRVITVPIVDTLVTDTTSIMTILGFRQFLIEPGSDGTLSSTIGDRNARFMVMYLGGDSTAGGNPVPLKQGRVDDPTGACQTNGVITGPGKVVLHQ